MIAIIVSVSGIALRALERSIEGLFDSVRLLAQIDEGDPIDWLSAVTIYDSYSPLQDVQALLRMVPAEALSRVIVLPKETHELLDFAPLVGKVGAVLLNSSSLEEIVLVARLMRTGLVLLPSMMIDYLRLSGVEIELRVNHLDPILVDSLTEREIAVLMLLSKGKSNKAIGSKLGINNTTVRVHIRSVLRKMGVSNRTQAALLIAEYIRKQDILRKQYRQSGTSIAASVEGDAGATAL